MTMDTRTAQALIRFGLGRRGTEPLPADPEAWLSGQLDGPDPADFAGAPSATDGLMAWVRDSRDPVADRKQSRVAEILATERRLQLGNLLTTQAPFRERLVLFWANHFTVSIARPETHPVMGAYVREAIRPHVTGRFVDMVLAVMRHPGMQLYLDNWLSMGPHSTLGKLSGNGLNENLGRECLELHTVSPAAGYHQADVIALATLLTGWTIDFNLSQPPQPPRFVFFEPMHEPGPKTLMGRQFPPGEAGGIEALRFLGTHPAAYRFIATKLVRHFVADDPPAADVARVSAVLEGTQGDLRLAALELLALPGAWRPLTKFRSAQDHVIAALRALDLPPGQGADPVPVMEALGQPWWTQPQPNGWPDTAGDWAAVVGLLARAEWAHDLAGRAGALDPAEVAQAALGPLLRPQTRARMAAAGSRREALTLLLTAPEFMRR